MLELRRKKLPKRNDQFDKLNTVNQSFQSIFRANPAKLTIFCIVPMRVIELNSSKESVNMLIYGAFFLFISMKNPRRLWPCQ